MGKEYLLVSRGVKPRFSWGMGRAGYLERDINSLLRRVVKGRERGVRYDKGS